MQLALELVSDLDVHKCMQRVILNECGRIAELVFEQVKLIPSKFEAVQMAEQLLQEQLINCNAKQICEVVNEVEERIWNDQSDANLNTSRAKCLNQLQDLVKSKIRQININSVDDAK